MVPNPDVAKAVGEQKTDTQVLVGFAAETEKRCAERAGKAEKQEPGYRGRQRRHDRRRGLRRGYQHRHVITNDAETSYEKMSKRELADRILDARSGFPKRRKGLNGQRFSSAA